MCIYLFYGTYNLVSEKKHLKSNDNATLRCQGQQTIRIAPKERRSLKLNAVQSIENDF